MKLGYPIHNDFRLKADVGTDISKTGISQFSHRQIIWNTVFQQGTIEIKETIINASLRETYGTR